MVHRWKEDCHLFTWPGKRLGC